MRPRRVIYTKEQDVEFAKRLGQELRKKRKEAGLSQRELAYELNISESTIKNYELGLTVPLVSIIARYCDLLFLDARKLMNLYFVD